MNYHLSKSLKKIYDTQRWRSKTNPKVKEQTPLRHAPCTVAGLPWARVAPPLGRWLFDSGRWASMLNFGGSFLARQSFASATPFAVESTACRPLLLPASGQPRPQTLPVVAFVRQASLCCLLAGQAPFAPAGVDVWAHSSACGDCFRSDAHPRLRLRAIFWGG